MFHAKGHPKIQSTHKTTLEFTKEAEVTEQGDCIVGVAADFDKAKLQAFAREQRIKMTITAGNVSDTLSAKPNPSFDDDSELVIRMGVFISPRTFAIDADKSAKYLNRELVEKIKEGKQVEVRIEKAAE